MAYSPGGYMTPLKREQNSDSDASFQVSSFYNILSDHDELSRRFSPHRFNLVFGWKETHRRGLQWRKAGTCVSLYCASCVHLEKGEEKTLDEINRRFAIFLPAPPIMSLRI